MRNIRRQAKDTLDKLVKDGEAGEDEVRRAEKEPRRDHAQVRRADRRAAQAQGGRAARGLTTSTLARPMTDAAAPTPGTDPAPAQHGRAGRNLASAIVIGASLGIVLVLLPVLYLPWLFARRVRRDGRRPRRSSRGALANRDIHIVALPLLRRGGRDAAGGVLVGPAAASSPSSAPRCWWSWAGDCVRRPGRATSPTPPRRSWSCRYLGLMAGFVGAHARVVRGRRRASRHSSSSRSAATSAATSPACCSASTRWPRSCRPRSPGRASPGRCCSRRSPASLLFVFLLDAPWWQGLVTGLVLTVTATAGDFVESAIKRDLGVKDMSIAAPRPRRADGPARLAAAQRVHLLAPAAGVPRPMTARGRLTSS